MIQTELSYEFDYEYCDINKHIKDDNLKKEFAPL